MVDWAWYPFASHVVDWLSGSFDPLASVLFARGNLDSSCTFSYFSQSQSFSFQAEDSERSVVELGWKNFVDNLKNYWENCEGNLKSWIDDLKNYWNNRNDLHGLTVGGHCCVTSMRNLGDFSS